MDFEKIPGKADSKTALIGRHYGRRFRKFDGFTDPGQRVAAGIPEDTAPAGLREPAKTLIRHPRVGRQVEREGCSWGLCADFKTGTFQPQGQ